MQKSAFAIIVSHFFSHISACNLEAKSSIQSLTSRFCIRETFSIQSSTLLFSGYRFNPRVYSRI